MSNRISYIPVHRGRTFDIMSSKYPGWMSMLYDNTDPLNNLIALLSTTSFSLSHEHIGNVRDQYIYTGNIGSNYAQYTISSDTDFLITDIISGEYHNDLGVSGTVFVSSMQKPSHIFDGCPTRFLFDSFYNISGELLDIVPTSGEGFSYVQFSPMSGGYLLSMNDDNSIYTLDEDYQIIASGNYGLFHVEENVSFIPLTGEYYYATLSHVPTGETTFFDIYNEGASISGLIQDRDIIEIPHDYLSWFGQLRARYDYNAFDSISRITTDRIVWNIPYFVQEPAYITDTSGVLTSIPFDFANTYTSGEVYLSCDPLDIMPGEPAQVIFSYDDYTHTEEVTSGVYQYSIPSGYFVYEDSIRLFSENGSEDSKIYYDSSTENFYLDDSDGLTTLYGISDNDYQSWFGDGYLTILNNTADDGPFHVTYYTRKYKTYNVFARQSYRRSTGAVDITPYWKDYTIKNNVLYPVSILPIVENDISMKGLLRSSPLESFVVNVRRSRKGFVYDSVIGNFWVLQNNDLLYRVDRPSVKYFVRIPSSSDEVLYTHLISDRKTDGMTASGEYYYRDYEMVDYEQGEQHLLRSMVIYDNYFAILTERNGTYYLVLVNKFDPTDISKHEVFGSEFVPGR